METRVLSRLGRWVVVVALLVLPRISTAQVSWAVAERDDAQILSLQAKLLPFVEKLPGVEDAPAVILFSQTQVDVDETTSRACRNFMLELRDPGAVPDRMLQPFLPSSLKSESLHAVILRDGAILRLEETAVRFEAGAEEIGRGRCRFDWPELKKGDTIVWSSVFEFPGPLPGIDLPVADIFPTVIFNLTLQGKHKYNYAIEPIGFPKKDLAVKLLDSVDSRPATWKASVNARAAIEDYRNSGPYPESTPHLAVRLTEVYFEPREGMPVAPQWIPVGGWNQLSIGMSGAIEEAAEEAGNLRIVLSAITSGRIEAVDKERAVFDFVREKIELLEGEEISDQGLRTISEVLKSKQATRREKVTLMAVMLRELEIPVTLGLLRDPQFGALREGSQTFFEFSDQVVRTGGDTPRFYAPQCTDCADRTYPASWSGAEVLTGIDGLAEKSEAVFQEWQQKAMAEGSIDIRAMRVRAEEQPWHRFEKLGD